MNKRMKITTTAIFLSLLLVSCGGDDSSTEDDNTGVSTGDTTSTETISTATPTAKDSKYFNIPWGMSTMEFKKNNPDIRFGQDNGNDALTNNYNVELFDCGVYGDFSAYFRYEEFASINVDITEVMESDAKDFLLEELEQVFGAVTYGSDTSSEFMYWENSETKVTIHTDSSYAHMVNKMFLERNTD